MRLPLAIARASLPMHSQSVGRVPRVNAILLCLCGPSVPNSLFLVVGFWILLLATFLFRSFFFSFIRGALGLRRPVLVVRRFLLSYVRRSYDLPSLCDGGGPLSELFVQVVASGRLLRVAFPWSCSVPQESSLRGVTLTELLCPRSSRIYRPIYKIRP